MQWAQINPQWQATEIVSQIGGQDSDQVSCGVCRKINSLERRIGTFIEPRLGYKILPIEMVGRSSIQLTSGVIFKSQKLSKTLRHCDRLIAFVATIGDRIEREVSHLMGQNRSSEAFILDSMGSLAVEKTVATFHDRQTKLLRPTGRNTTLRFSPGYCDWPVVEQKNLFSLFGGGQLRVELTASNMMRPRKSISGVFGITLPDSHSISYRYNPCNECSKADCPERRYQPSDSTSAMKQ